LVVQESPVLDTVSRAYDITLLPHEQVEMDEYNAAAGLCTFEGNYSCMPPSIRYVHGWDKLDQNGDGLWSKSEALKLAEEIRSGSVTVAHLTGALLASPTILFDSIIRTFQAQHQTPGQTPGGLLNANSSLYVSQAIQKGFGIPKAYFEYWGGHAMFCTHFDRDSCRKIIASGLFTAALEPGHVSAAHTGIKDLSSALEYCESMLAENGGCEYLLPASFQENRAKRWATCGAHESLTSIGSYENPYNSEEKIFVLNPSYTNLSKRMSATRLSYLILSGAITFVFWASLLPELRALIKYVDFLRNFPEIDHSGSESEASPSSRMGLNRSRSKYGFETPKDSGIVLDEDESKSQVTITGISSGHRATLFIVWIFRCVTWVFVAEFGTWFLVDEIDWTTLVGKTLALAFILQTDEGLYQQMLDKHVQSMIESMDPFLYETSFPDPKKNPWVRYAMRKSCWGLVVLPPLIVAVVYAVNHYTRLPLVEAMHCACELTGERCHENSAQQMQWWDDYWSRQLPAALQQIQVLSMTEQIEMVG